MRANIWFLALLAAASLTAQTMTTGEVTGMVLDPSGAAVTTATVLLKSVDTGESRTSPSNASGLYRFTFVRPGNYEISGTSADLKSDIGRLVAAVGQVQVVDLRFKLEAAKEVVMVTGTAPLLNTDNASATYTVSTRELELLPLPGADLVGVAYSMPGVVINNRPSSTLGGGNFASQGVGGTSNLFTLNGVDIVDPYSNLNNSGPSGLLLGANEVQEASVVQNAYEGQYGRQAGAEVNYVSKYGTNTYHGNMVYNWGGTVLNSNDFVNNSSGTPRPHAVANQYAASFGGRVIRDKLFFFADTEGWRRALPASASVVAIPSPALQRYSLKAIQAAQVPLYQKMFDLYNAAPGHERAVPVTNGGSPLQDGSMRLGCGSLTGTPTGTGGVFGRDVSCAQAWGTNVPSQASEWLLATRADYNLNARHGLFFRFKTDHGSLPFNVSVINPAFSGLSVQPDYEGQLNYTYVITPRLVNNFIGSVNYNDYVFGFADLAAALKLFPFRINIMNGGANGYFGLTPMGAGAAFPQGRRNGQLQIVDDISYNAGRHSLKAGANYRYNREADLAYSQFAYIGRFNLFGLDEFAAGALNGGDYKQAFSVNPVLHLRLYNLGVYVQDQWAINPHLKLSAALRFDRNGNPYCLDLCFARLSSPFPELSKGLTIPYNQSIQAGLPHAFYLAEPIVPQPRFSVVYNPSWSKATVLRGGIGLFSDLYPALFAGTMAGNPPNVFTAGIRTGLVNTSGTGSAPAIAAASANAFQSQYAQGATLSQLQQAVLPAPFGAPPYYSIPSTVRSPKYLEWSFEIQQQLGGRNVLTVRYSGHYGYDIFLTNPNVNASANPALYPKGFGGLPGAPPDPRFNVVQQLTNNGYSNYDGLITTFRRAFSHGFQGQVGYTWSHALDTVSNGGLTYFSYDSISGQIDPRDVRSLNYSNADYDIRHQLTADFLWEIPLKFKSRLSNTLFAGWSVASRLNAHTGNPFSVTNYNFARRLSASFGGPVLADVLDPNIRTACGHSAIDMPCFSASQFATTNTQADFGNRPRNSFRGPGYFNLDSSLYRTVAFGERVRLTLGASAYNVLNHPSFSDPNSDVSSSGLGLVQYTAVNPSSPYGSYGGPSGRALVVTGRFVF
jgi:hypothetical protein